MEENERERDKKSVTGKGGRKRRKMCSRKESTSRKGVEESMRGEGVDRNRMRAAKKVPEKE